MDMGASLTKPAHRFAAKPQIGCGLAEYKSANNDVPKSCITLLDVRQVLHQSHLSDDEWRLLKPLLPKPDPSGAVSR
jgi:hypothetical protein